MSSITYGAARPVKADPAPNFKPTGIEGRTEAKYR